MEPRSIVNEKVDSKTGIRVTTTVTEDAPIRYVRGAARSVAKLRTLQFDPISELVSQYRKLQEELTYQERLRSGAIVELNANGKPRSYRVDAHLSIYDKLREIGKELLRYGYGRVPELNVLEQRAPMPLIVNLTKKGEVFTINDNSERTGEYDGEE